MFSKYYRVKVILFILFRIFIYFIEIEVENDFEHVYIIIFFCNLYNCSVYIKKSYNLCEDIIT